MKDIEKESRNMIRILYIGDHTIQSPETILTRQAGFSLDILPQWPAREFKHHQSIPDIVCIDTKSLPAEKNKTPISQTDEICNILKELFSPYPPAILAVIDVPDTGKTFLDWTKSCADQILTTPIDPEEIKKAGAIHMERRLLAQKCEVMEKAQKKSTELLDRFSAQLAAAKDELIEERQNLNQAFKQIQSLTSERDRMEQKFAQMENLWYQDQQGMEEILKTLIVKRVETNKGHGDRVAVIADFLAGELGMDEDSRATLGKAARLHQIGLLAMPAAQSSGYDPDMEIQYPVHGARLLSQCHCFRKAADIISGIHEKADGSGFPKGLKKQNIPLLTRILTGAAVLDTIKDLPEITNADTLLSRLEEEAGITLDPKITGILEKYILLHSNINAEEKIRGVGVEQLIPGMELACSIFTHTGSKLFSAGTLLDADAVEKLIQYNKSYPVDDIIYVKKG